MKLTAENKTLDNEAGKLREKNEELQVRVCNFEERMQKLDEIFEQTKAMADDDTMSVQIQELHKKIASIQREKESLEKITKELTTTLHDMQSKYEEVKSEMESTKRNCDKEIHLLQNQLREMNSDVGELRKMLDFMEAEMYSTAEEKLQLKAKLEREQSRLNELHEQKLRLEEILDDKQQKDMKNMKMVNQKQKNTKNVQVVQARVIPDNDTAAQTASNNDDNVAVEQESQQVTVAQFAQAISAMTESLADLNEAYDLQSEVEDDNIPSFNRAYHMLDLGSNDSSSHKFTQTNITIAESEYSGFLLDDNGGFHENCKDVCTIDAEIQTEEILQFEEMQEMDEFFDENETKDDSEKDIDEIMMSERSADTEYVQGVKTTDNESEITVPGEMEVIGEIDLQAASGFLEMVDRETQTDASPSNEDLNDNESYEADVAETTAELEVKLREKEAEIEKRLLQKYEDREQNISLLEENFESRMKQIEYEIEDNYIQKVRDREVEIALECEMKKRKAIEEMTLETERKIERIKMEKDQQFVETLQKVKADFDRKERSRSRRSRQHVSSDRATEGQEQSALGPEGDMGEHLDHLQQENQELASVRDDLVHQIEKDYKI
ncbi:hypothetical protein MAR_006985 [Mya arenaria]|uniref:Uncharacterized protein n=1 Tax=Mya arenaria TaxID=6604 RepID=A0ABY7DA34_MYAAR|nr:hypothetical protein MAR_006985 [Mya arenaria]